jgi:branched-chain amino acid transport system substrate-binding protein
VIITGISHVGVQPTVQWHDQQVPIPMVGVSAQATTSTFWKDTNGAADGVITDTAAARVLRSPPPPSRSPRPTKRNSE